MWSRVFAHLLLCDCLIVFVSSVVVSADFALASTLPSSDGWLFKLQKMQRINSLYNNLEYE